MAGANTSDPKEGTDHLAGHVVGVQALGLQDLVGEGAGVVQRQPHLNRRPLVRVPVLRSSQISALFSGVKKRS